MIRDGLRMCWQVVFHTNLAFTTIRDDYRKYFQFSIGLALVVIIPHALVLQLNASGAWYQIIENLGLATFGVVTYLGVVYLVGRVWGGNPHWGKVITVMCYTFTATIAAAIVLVPVNLILPYYATIPLMIAEAVWLVIINIKAVKIVNGFGTAKALVVVVMAFVASYALLLLSYFT